MRARGSWSGLAMSPGMLVASCRLCFARPNGAHEEVRLHFPFGKGCKSPWFASVHALRSCSFVQRLAHLKPKGRESGGSELLIRQQVHISRRLKLLPLSRCRQVPKFLSEDNVHPCAKGHIHPVGSTAACSILPRSLPSCPLLLLGFLQVAFAAITPVRALPVGLAHARDPLHSTQHFWRALQNAYRLQKRVEKPSKQNTALASAPQDRVAAPCQAGWGKPARPSRLHFAAVPCAAGRTPEAQARC